jgi:Putative phage metallopeptidase
MPRGRSKTPKGPKAKAVNYRIIPPLDANDHEPEPYKLLNEVRDKYHEDTRQARVALAWRLREKPDKDGRIVLGRCIKVSDLNKEFASWDFIITLNKIVWDDPEFDKKKKLALLDHEMCHAAPSLDEESGEHKRDELDRLVYRTKKHSIEEFTEIVERHGCYKSDLERFAETLLKKMQPKIKFPESETKPTKSGPKELAEFHAQAVQ